MLIEINNKSFIYLFTAALLAVLVLIAFHRLVPKTHHFRTFLHLLDNIFERR